MSPAKKSASKVAAPKAVVSKATVARKVVGAKVQSVASFLAALEHAHKAEILLLREIILATDASISEAIKWNAPSFQTTEFFATTNLRAKAGTAVILHFGAKKRDLSPRGVIADPTGLLQWLADDRAIVGFADVADLKAKRTAFTAVIREWIRHV